MSNKLSQQLDTIWKYTRFIFKNIKAFRASRRLYEVRTNLSLANIEIGQMTYHDPLYSQRVREFNQVMVELIRGKWLAACAMEAKDKNEAKDFWEQAFTRIRVSKEYSQELLETLQTKSQEPLSLPETALCFNGKARTSSLHANLVLSDIRRNECLLGSAISIITRRSNQVREAKG